MIIDTHCHLYNEYYSDLEEILENMQQNNIYAITNGCDLKSNIESLNLSKNHENIFCSIGYHPTEINNIEEDYLSFLEDNKDYVVAIGEIGLDYYWNKENKDIQIEVFESQLLFAEQNSIPVIIHNREATVDVYNILKKYKLNGVIHAFSGSYETAEMFIKLGYKLGVGGVLTFKNTNLREIIKKIDIKNIVLETDSPYLSPEPKRGKRNEPGNLKYIAKILADIKGISYEEVCYLTSKNAIELFDLNIKI